MIEPGAPTSAPQLLAAATAASRDRLGRRRRRRPRGLRTPERASAPPHNRAAPRGASWHARARGRRAPAAPPPPRPSLICRLGRGRARAPGRAGSAEASGVSSCAGSRAQGKGKASWGDGRAAGPLGCERRARARARGRARAGGADGLGATAPPSAGSVQGLLHVAPRPLTSVPSRSRPRLLHVTSAPPSVTRGPARGMGASQCGDGPRGKLSPGSRAGSGSRPRRPRAAGTARAERGSGPLPPSLFSTGVLWPTRPCRLCLPCSPPGRSPTPLTPPRLRLGAFSLALESAFSGWFLF